MQISQTMSNQGLEKLANNYKGFYEPLQDLIDNSVEAKASKIHIYIGISSDSSKRKIIIEDNGCGIKYDREVLKKVFGYGYTKKRNSLNEHGFGLKTAIVALGSLTLFSSFVEGEDEGFKILKMEDNKVDAIAVSKASLDKSEKHSGTKIKINGLRTSKVEGISLYGETKEDIKKNVDELLIHLGRTYAIRIKKGLKIHCEIEDLDTGKEYCNNLVKGFFPKGEIIHQEHYKESDDGIEFKVTWLRQLEEDPAFPLVQAENQRLIYSNDRLIMIPSSADKAYGKPVKWIEFRDYREIIEIINVPGLTTKQTKDGFVINRQFKDLILKKEKICDENGIRKNFSSENKYCDSHDGIICVLEEKLLSEGCAISKADVTGVGLKPDFVARYNEGKKDVIHLYEVKSQKITPADVTQLLTYSLLKQKENPKAKIKATLVGFEFNKKVISIINEYNSKRKIYGIKFEMIQVDSI